MRSEQPIEPAVLEKMTASIRHRGPDSTAYFIDRRIGLGFQRLSIIDIENGHQPFFSEDRSIQLICNGEIYNYKLLREELIRKGYRFHTNCDIEVLLPLYMEYGISFLEKLNGQFAIALFDSNHNFFLLARDHFGICPLFYTIREDRLVFGSEIKAILQYPGIERKVDMTGLDQIFSFPGMLSPVTMFRNISSLKPGSYLAVTDGVAETRQYWDLSYPQKDHVYASRDESFYLEKLEALLLDSVSYRLNADVPVGFYLSGGLDSSLIGALMRKLRPGELLHSFGIGFPEFENKDIDERKYQRIVSGHLGSTHHEIPFDWTEIDQRIKNAVYYAEAPLKETYNTCSLALSESVNREQIKVILSGEGADEFFGGYVGYRFDVQRNQQPVIKNLEVILEEQERKKLWGDENFFYERDYYDFSEIKKALYSVNVNQCFPKFNAYENLSIDKSQLSGRNSFHKRSYLDFKLRLSDHLVSDHCDRTCYANAVEGRYPFLDVDLVEFVKTIPTDLKLKGLVEKYILKEVGRKYLPATIFNRQKQGFVAPGSPYLIKNGVEWINDLLSYERIKRQGYFNPDTIENLKRIYKEKDFKLNLPFDSDLLIIVLTFNIFLEVFDLPDYVN